MIAYHFLQANMTSPNAPRTKWVEGQSRTLKGMIVPCQRGYHASPSLWDALTYAPGPVACLVELSGEIVPHKGDKFAASTRKLIKAVNIEKDLRLFAVDCAEHVLWLYERDYPNDDRPRKAIQAARDYAEGRIAAAASDAAWAAASDAASDAAWAAASDAASDAARAAAWAAASAAARATTSAAARATTSAAARAATSAAASDATSAAASDAERDRQRQQFEQRFGGIFEPVRAASD